MTFLGGKYVLSLGNILVEIHNYGLTGTNINKKTFLKTHNWKKDIPWKKVCLFV